MGERGESAGWERFTPRAGAPWSVATYLALIVAASGIAIAAATAYGYLWNAGHARAAARREMNLEARRAAALITSATAEAEKSVAQLAAQPGLDKAFTAAGASRDCQLSVEGSEAFPSVRLDIVGRDGGVVCTSKPLPSVRAPGAHRGSPWLARALRARGPLVAWHAVDAATHRPAVAAAAPITAGGRAVGAVVAFEHLDGTAAALAANVGGARHPSFTLVSGRSAPGPGGRISASAPVPGSGWTVYAAVRRSAVLAGARGTLTRQLLVGALALLILVLAGWFLNRRVARPLRALSRAVGRASLSDQGAHVDETGAAEVVTLARRFNAMLDLRAGHEAELLHQATHDAHTGLPNIVLFRQRLDQALQQSSGPGLAVLRVRVNRLDVVNEGFGRATGDRVLAEVAARLSSAMRPGDTLGRSGGSEFVVLCPGIGEEGALEVGRRLHSCLAEPFRGPVSDIVLKASVGLAFARAGATGEQLLREADSAMREARRSGRDVQRFDHELQLRATEHLALEHALWTALQEEQLEVHYQPLVESGSGRIVGTEALVRWRHPERGMVMPAEFIGVAEETGQIFQIDRYVLARACRQAAAWTAAGHRVRMSVNVAASQLTDERFHDFVGWVLADTGLAPSQLCLEITETSLMREAARDQSQLMGLKRLGVALSIDDFGTGYSSLAYLHELPVDELKIDRSFITRLGRDRRDRHLVEAIVGMARALGLEVLAEGVESEHQLQVLHGLGCTRIQGYLVARPQPPDRVLSLLEAQADEERLAVPA
ncbi:MAG TPA: sensor domain-containing phosphodiesterase [Thermoleophilaceae bacterium]